MRYSPKPFSGHIEPSNDVVKHRDLNALIEYLENELVSISRAMQEYQEVELRATHREPVRPQEGMIVYTDATNWDPGLGEGFYGYHDGAWCLLTMTCVVPVAEYLLWEPGSYLVTETADKILLE